MFVQANLVRAVSIGALLVFLAACDETGREWKKAESEHAVQAYEAFIAKHPGSAQAGLARAMIASIRFDRADAAGSVAAYEEFLEQHQDGQFAARAEWAIDELKNGPFTATVTDHAGASTRVAGLRASYVASGMWIGPRPRSVKPAVHVVLAIEEARVTTQEVLEFPFYQLESIHSESRDSGDYSMRFNKLDGGRAVIRHASPMTVSLYREDGTLERQIDPKWVLLASDKEQGEWLYLEGFEGSALAASGKEGDYYIEDQEVAGIVFEHEAPAAGMGVERQASDK